MTFFFLGFYPTREKCYVALTLQMRGCLVRSNWKHTNPMRIHLARVEPVRQSE